MMQSSLTIPEGTNSSESNEFKTRGSISNGPDGLKTGGTTSSDIMEDSSCDKDLEKLRTLVGVMRENYKSLGEELNILQNQQEVWQQSNSLMSGEVVVARSDIQKLSKELRMFKNLLSRLTNQDILPHLENLGAVHTDLQRSEQASDLAENERDHWRSQWKSIMESSQAEKQEKLALTCELQEVSQQLSQQSEFCATMGAACCTLLWRVSRCEDSIPSILVGSKVEEFLGVVNSTLESYLETYKDEAPPADDAEEMQFVLALCGIITNIAASAYGRDFLMKHTQAEQVVDTAVRVLAHEPCKKFAKMKNLILMTLYNLTINQKGLKYLTSKSELLPLLAWQIQDENELENQLHSLRLLQSLLCDQVSPQIIHQAKEMMQGSWLDDLCSHTNKQLRETAVEFRTDLYLMLSEQ